MSDETKFLLVSLADLELEHDAGDLSDEDYETLRDEYTARAAQLIRADPVVPAQRPAAARGRRVLWGVAVSLFAVGAGLVMARAVGSRGSSESSTGDIRNSTASLLIEAQEALSAGEPGEARDAYDRVLEIQPTNAEALTYRGWLSFQEGDVDAARADLADAVAADARLPDARVFSAVVALRGDADPAAAAVELVAFDALEPPPVMLQLVRQFALRSDIAAALLDGGDEAAAISVLAAGSAPELLIALSERIDSGEVVDALEVIDAVIAAAPESASPLAARGLLLALSADSARIEGLTDRFEQLAASAEEWLDRAVGVDATSADAFALRAVVRSRVLDDPDGAAADAAAYGALGVPDPDLDRLLADEGLTP